MSDTWTPIGTTYGTAWKGADLAQLEIIERLRAELAELRKSTKPNAADRERLEWVFSNSRIRYWAPKDWCERTLRDRQAIDHAMERK